MSDEKAIVKNPDKEIVLHSNSMFFDTAKFIHAQRVAKMLATATMVPEHFRNNIGNCLIALNLADRFGADPFMILQNVYIVHGKPGLEGKLVIALVNQSGKFTPLQYKFARDDNGKATACTAYATHNETKEKLEQTVTWDMVHAEGWDAKKGSKWMTMPELMFQYRSATFFARVYCPEVILGMQTTDEIFDFTNMTNQGGTYRVDNTGASDLSEKIKEAKKEDVPEYGSKEYAKKMVEGSEGGSVRVDKPEAFHQKAEQEEPTKIDEPEPSEPEKPKTIEEPFFEGQEPDLQKMEGSENNGFDWNAWRDEWINMRSPGFSSHVHKNRSRWDDAPAEMQAEGEVKWHKFYRTVPWPVKNKPIDNEDEKVQMIKAISDLFDPDDVTKALRAHEQEAGLTSCDMAMLRTIYTYLRENTDMAEELA